MPAGPSPVGLAGVVLALVSAPALAVPAGLAVAGLVTVVPSVGLLGALPVLIPLPSVALLSVALLVLALLALVLLVFVPPLVLAPLSTPATALASPPLGLLAVRLQPLLLTRLSLVPVDAVDVLLISLAGLPSLLVLVALSVLMALLALWVSTTLLSVAPLTSTLLVAVSLPVVGFVRAVLGPVAARFVAVVVLLASVPVVVPFRVSALIVGVAWHGR